MQKRPNIVFILIDDMGWRDLACYGSEFYETPNIDKLAREGMFFTDAYAASPVCSPTRASILSGKYPARVGVTNWIEWNNTLLPLRGKLIDAPYVKCLPLSEKSLAAALKEGGYNTWHIGKWHLGFEDTYPDKHGFDVNIAGFEWGLPSNGYFSPWGIKNLEDGPEGEYLNDRITDEAIKLINKNDGRPFFLNLWHYAVHRPIQAKEEDIERFRKKAADMGLDKKTALVDGEHMPTVQFKHLRVTRRIIQSDPAYAAMVYNLDWNIGRLLKALEDAGQSGNTLVIFTSDNGGLSTATASPTCNYPLNEGKGWMYDGGVREPLIVKWPGVVKEGSVCSETVTSPDFYPTILEAAGLPLIPEQHIDGVSILGLLEGREKIDREAVYWHYPHYGGVTGSTPGSSIRMGDYKLIEFFEDNRVELYDLRKDIGEENDLAGDMPDLVSVMKKKLADWRNDVEAKVPEINQNAEAEMADTLKYMDHGSCDDKKGKFFRLGDYKLIEYLDTGRYALYNVKEDPDEKNDLSDVMSGQVEVIKTFLKTID